MRPTRPTCAQPAPRAPRVCPPARCTSGQPWHTVRACFLHGAPRIGGGGTYRRCDGSHFSRPRPFRGPAQRARRQGGGSRCVLADVHHGCRWSARKRNACSVATWGPRLGPNCLTLGSRPPPQQVAYATTDEQPRPGGCGGVAASPTAAFRDTRTGRAPPTSLRPVRVASATPLLGCVTHVTVTQPHAWRTRCGRRRQPASCSFLQPASPTLRLAPNAAPARPCGASRTHTGPTKRDVPVWEGLVSGGGATSLLSCLSCLTAPSCVASTAARPALLPGPAGRGLAGRGRCRRRCPPATRSTATPPAAPHPSTPRHHTPGWRTSVQGVVVRGARVSAHADREKGNGAKKGHAPAREPHIGPHPAPAARLPRQPRSRVPRTPAAAAAPTG